MAKRQLKFYEIYYEIKMNGTEKTHLMVVKAYTVKDAIRTVTYKVKQKLQRHAFHCRHIPNAVPDHVDDVIVDEW